MPKRFPDLRSEENPTELAHPTLRALRAYWDLKRGNRRMPSRGDIRPAEIRQHLPWIVMVDVLPGFVNFRYRLIGTLVTRYFSTDPTGKTITDAWASQGEEGVEGVLSILRLVAKNGLVLRLYGEAGWNTIGLEEFECLYLPLSDDGENVNVILNVFVFDRPEVLLARDIIRGDGGGLLDVSRPAA